MIDMTAQGRICSSFNHHEHKKHTAQFMLEGMRQIFNDTLIDEASRLLMRPNDS